MYFIYCGSLVVFLGTICVRALKMLKSATGVRRIELQFFLISICSACALIIVLSASGRFFHISALPRLGPVVYLALNCLLAWALAFHHVFDARQVVVSLGQRVGLLLILGFLSYETSRFLTAFLRNPFNVVGGSIIAGLIVYYLYLKSCHWLSLDIDVQLSEPRARIITLARGVPDPQELTLAFEGYLSEWCHTSRVELLAGHDKTAGDRLDELGAAGFSGLRRQGWITPEYLQRLRPEPPVLSSFRWLNASEIAALIAVPRGSDSPSLYLILGVRQSLRPYTYPEISVLVRIVELMDNILSHARLAATAARISRLEAAATMSRGLAHDLNNLTTPVATYLLHRDGQDPPGSAEAYVHRAATRAMGVVQDYIRESLFFSRKLVPDFHDVNAQSIIEPALGLARERSLERGVDLRASFDSSLCFSADAALLKRLLLNLLHNAIDASPSGAVVEISLQLRKTNLVCLAVSDQGVGIPREVLGRIFEPYFTTKGTGELIRGLGLGLAICRKIADLHGGEIDVHSSPGRGTKFVFTFPLRLTIDGLSTPSNNSIASVR
ncbi:MAG TPA: HAMP domain-containing sensor histidine kinase [Lacunisphaera sp.]|nr:HAMP domain-containing sensor histidine kinase [Lacunisphaera sp.]